MRDPGSFGDVFGLHAVPDLEPEPNESPEPAKRRTPRARRAPSETRETRADLQAEANRLRRDRQAAERTARKTRDTADRLAAEAEAMRARLAVVEAKGDDARRPHGRPSAMPPPRSRRTTERSPRWSPPMADTAPPPRPGPLALVGGAELGPGNEPQDRLLADTAGDGPAFVLATAAARHRPELAVATPRVGSQRFGLAHRGAPATGRRQTRAAANAERARTGRFFISSAATRGSSPHPPRHAGLGGRSRCLRDGAALGGSSAGAMALGEWTLTRETAGATIAPVHPGLCLVPGVAVVPHFERSGPAGSRARSPARRTMPSHCSAWTSGPRPSGRGRRLARDGAGDGHRAPPRLERDVRGRRRKIDGLPRPATN